MPFGRKRDKSCEVASYILMRPPPSMQVAAEQFLQRHHIFVQDCKLGGGAIVEQLHNATTAGLVKAGGRE